MFEANTPSLNSLLQSAREGDRAAFDQLVGLVEVDVLRTARYLVRNHDDSLDVAQEVYMKMLRRAPPLDRLDNLRGWLYRVTVNVARDLLRRRRLRFPLKASIEWFWPRDPVQSKELRGRLIHAMKGLSFNERAAFVFRELHEIETAEVARILGCRQTTVRGYVHSARRKLQRHFPEYRETR